MVKEQNWEEKYKRARADYINLERRVKNQQEEFLKFANSVLVLKLLPILDGLEKAVRINNDNGLKLVLKNFWDVLKSEGVEEIEVKVGGQFDPQIMECTVAEGGGDEVKVSEVLRKGYKMKGKVLRPVQVSVKNSKS
jgi:molecular chaperone GrpE